MKSRTDVEDEHQKRESGTSVLPYGNMGVLSPEGCWFNMFQLDNIPRPDQEKHSVWK